MYDISSLQNSRVKRVVKLNQRRQRDAERVTVVEGVRELGRALACSVVPSEAFICPDLITDTEAEAVVAHLETLPTETLRVTSAVFEKMAYRATGGLLAVIPYFTRPLDALPLSDPPFLVVVDGAEKPGNLGAILRTADGAGVDGLILTNDLSGGTDVHNPNAIRASLGAVFSVPIAEATTAETVAWLREKHIGSVATTPDTPTLYTDADLVSAVAVVMGSEAFGLSDDWLAAADQRVRIPMHGLMDSLNLSTATALLLYEVIRQRARQP